MNEVRRLIDRSLLEWEIIKLRRWNLFWKTAALVGCSYMVSDIVNEMAMSLGW